MTRVRDASMERYLNDIFEVELNFIGCQRIRESIKWRLQLSFEIADNSYNLVDGRLVQHAAWPPDKQTNVFAKFDVRRHFHCTILTYHATSVTESIYFVDVIGRYSHAKRENYSTDSALRCASIGIRMNARAQEIAFGLPPDLDALPRLGRSRLRGIAMTRLEPFIDAAAAKGLPQAGKG